MTPCTAYLDEIGIKTRILCFCICYGLSKHCIFCSFATYVYLHKGYINFACVFLNIYIYTLYSVYPLAIFSFNSRLWDMYVDTSSFVKAQGSSPFPYWGAPRLFTFSPLPAITLRWTCFLYLSPCGTQARFPSRLEISQGSVWVGENLQPSEVLLGCSASACPSDQTRDEV